MEPRKSQLEEWLREECVTLDVGRFLGDVTVATAQSNRMRLADCAEGAIRLSFVGALSEEPHSPVAEFLLLNFRVLHEHFDAQRFC